MNNIIKDVVNKLDGFSSDNQGFMVTSFVRAGKDDTGTGLKMELHVKPYIKDEERDGLPEEEHLIEMANRLLASYSEQHYVILKVEKMENYWKLVIKQLEKKENEVQAD